MKEEQPKLVLDKKTVAHLNNLEMRQVRGGDGDGDMSRGECDKTVEIDKKSVYLDAARLMLSQLLKVC